MNILTNLKKLVPRYFVNIYHLLLFKYYWWVSGLDIGNCKLIGVTGTSGKTTTVFTISHLLNENGYRTGLISSVSAEIGGYIIPTGLHVTTADPREFISIMREMLKNNAQYIVVEMSSHALENLRLGHLPFNYAVYTNITEDHLDWHKTWNKYACAKARLIDRFNDKGIVVVNRDDKQAYKFLHNYIEKTKRDRRIKLLTYSVRHEVNKGKNNAYNQQLEFKYKDTLFKVPIEGQYNIENILASIKVVEEIGVSLADCATALATFTGVKGRGDVLQIKPFKVIVDFAHNTDSLEKSLRSLRSSLNGGGNGSGDGGRLITVFGSAGHRDVNKRSTMGKVSGKLSDITIVTAEDPRTESLREINSKIIAGAESEGAKLIKRFADRNEMMMFLEDMDSGVDFNRQNAQRLAKKRRGGVSNHRSQDNGSPKVAQQHQIYAFDEETVNSRYDAVEFAMRIAKPGDTVVMQGKGHEQSLCFGEQEYEYSDYDAVEKVLDMFDVQDTRGSSQTSKNR